MQKGPVGLLLIMFPKLLAFPALVNSLLELFFFFLFLWSLPVLPGLHPIIPYYSFWLFTVLFLSVSHQHAMTFHIPFLSPLPYTTLPQTP